MEIPQNAICKALVVKVASRCNLNCTYCYMYNMGDTTYKNQPKVMQHDVIGALINEINSYCLKYELKTFLIVFHGGEPLLTGKDFYEDFVTAEKKIIGDKVRLIYTIQTNAVLLTDAWCELFARLNITVGISLDGTAAINNKYRIDHSGKGSYDRIVKGLKIAQNNAKINRALGIITVINNSVSPYEVYSHFKELGIRKADFLFPDANYEHQPIRTYNNPLTVEYEYGQWLSDLFDLWIADDSSRIKINFFENIILTLLGERVSNEVIGTENNELLVIETDGSIESVDTLRICGNGITKEDINIKTSGLADAFNNEMVKLYYSANKNLCKTCSSCPVSEVCGGGYLPHRYKNSNGFDNPSVYCKDLMKLITHIQNNIFSQLPAEILEESQITMLSYHEAKSLLIN